HGTYRRSDERSRLRRVAGGTAAMSDTSPDRQQLHAGMQRVWGNPRGWRALTTVNHTTLGLRFMGTGMAFFVFGGLLAMLLRAQLALPENRLLDHEIYNQLFT